MADGKVQWIKLAVDIFEDDKIDFIETMPEADAIFKIWIRLLALAGKCNAGGFIMLTEHIPYTEEMLAEKCKKPIKVVRLALKTFQNLGMISDENGKIFITNFSKHQNLDRLDKIRENDRQRKRESREKAKEKLSKSLQLEQIPRNVHGQYMERPENVRTPEIEIEKDKKNDYYSATNFESSVDNSVDIVDKLSDFALVVKKHYEVTGRQLSPALYQTVKGYLQQLPVDVVLAAYDQAAGFSAKGFEYIRKILDDLISKSIKTAEEAKAIWQKDDKKASNDDVKQIYDRIAKVVSSVGGYQVDKAKNQLGDLWKYVVAVGGYSYLCSVDMGKYDVYKKFEQAYKKVKG